MVGEALGELKRREDQMPSWIQSEEEGPSVPAAIPIILNMASIQSFPRHNKHGWMDLQQVRRTGIHIQGKPSFYW